MNRLCQPPAKARVLIVQDKHATEATKVGAPSLGCSSEPHEYFACLCPSSALYFYVGDVEFIWPWLFSCWGAEVRKTKKEESQEEKDEAGRLLLGA